MKQLLTLDKVNQPRKNRKAAGNMAKNWKSHGSEKKKKKKTYKASPFFHVIQNTLLWEFCRKVFHPSAENQKEFI